MSTVDYRDLLTRAEAARQRAYAPYSHYTVGACLLSADGKLYEGCNIENASSGCCLCAERTAVAKAVSEGVHSFAAIAVVGAEAGSMGDFCTPCGICRQVLAEFDGGEMQIVMQRHGEVIAVPLAQILPLAFRLED